MGSTPQISVIIPVFNGANYLKEAIDSVLKQTCNEYELIVVNDGSNDGGVTESIAKSFGEKIRYFYKENGGVASALNVGISHMRSEWFVWLSHDDLMSINRVESDLRLIQLHPNVRVFYCRGAIVDASGGLVQEVHYPILEVTSPSDAYKLGGMNICAMTIHHSCFQKVGLFNEENMTCQDTEMSLRLASDYLFFFNQEATSYRREHPNRGTNTLFEQRMQDRLLLSKIIHDEIGFEKFFKSVGDDANVISQSWVFMGQIYESLGALHYAEECYRNSANGAGFTERLVRIKEISRIKGKSPSLIKFLNWKIMILNKATVWFNRVLHVFK
jgi:glycosyltransferase involved in cell wall biosynthesis